MWKPIKYAKNHQNGRNSFIKSTTEKEFLLTIITQAILLSVYQTNKI